MLAAGAYHCERLSLSQADRLHGLQNEGVELRQLELTTRSNSTLRSGIEILRSNLWDAIQ